LYSLHGITIIEVWASYKPRPRVKTKEVVAPLLPGSETIGVVD
jgi:hypothetical protein